TTDLSAGPRVESGEYLKLALLIAAHHGIGFPRKRGGSMEKIKANIGALVLLLLVACAGCRDGVDANGIPLDRVPPGFQAKECHFEDLPSSPTDEPRWQRLVCRHG